MYIWIGCKLPEDFEQEIRTNCLRLNEKIGLSTVAFTLPQHISLKISFEAETHEAVLGDLTDYLSRQTPFSVSVQGETPLPAGLSAVSKISKT